MANIGMLVDGKYEIIAEIGRGGMSVVYLAIDRRLNKQWAVKEAKKKPGQDSDVYELTPIAEANLLKSLDHPNIVRIVDIIEQNGYIYIVEDFVEGKSLSEEVKKGPTPPERVVEWGAQLCDTLEYLHSRRSPIIYRDMKPANVQLQPDRKKVKLLDFGIAKTYKENNVGDTRNLGTRGYAAPEQFDMNRQSDRRTDVFSLGVTLRALLMGKTPYDAEFYDDIRKQNSAVTDGLVKVIAKATDPDPQKRFQTADEFKYALLHYHDRDAAVIRIKKRKLNSFRGLLASSISLFLVGLMLLPISSGVRSVDYNEKLRNGNYKECISINSGNAEAYFRLLEDNADNAATMEFDSEEINYKNISDIQKRREFALECAMLIDISGMGKSKMRSFYEDLVNDFSEDDVHEIKSDDSDMAEELNSCANIYQAIGKIKLFYNDIDVLIGKSSNDAEFALTQEKKDKIYKNIAAINAYMNDTGNKQKLQSDELNEIFSKQKHQINGVNDFYDFLTKWQIDCLIANREAFIQNENKSDIEKFVACVNTESEYGRNNKSNLNNPKN